MENTWVRLVAVIEIMASTNLDKLKYVKYVGLTCDNGIQ